MACEVAKRKRQIWIIEDTWNLFFGRDVAAQGGLHGGLGSGAGQTTKLDRYMRRKVEELRLIRFNIGQWHEGKGFMSVLVCRGDFG